MACFECQQSCLKGGCDEKCVERFMAEPLNDMKYGQEACLEEILTG